MDVTPLESYRVLSIDQIHCPLNKNTLSLLSTASIALPIMRLLNVHTLKLEKFFNPARRPNYAILSHTWGKGEVSLRDLSTPAVRSKAGYAKIKKFCEMAIRDGYKYVWVDTCCIDKTSSSELSEAINSMYQWYKDAGVCYVYLSDITASGGFKTELDSRLTFSGSRWFKRGWTLQELLAPESVIFYTSDWVDIGTKYTLQQDISEATTIPCDMLFSRSTAEISIGQRMSWAAMRQTTRVEDEAYCLMGIFGVNMPTLYGEGSKAFIRLQLEIMKDSDDHTVFAWVDSSENDYLAFDFSQGSDPNRDTFRYHRKPPYQTGLLASSPQLFRYSQNVKRLEVSGSSRFPYSMTNLGLHIRLPLVQATVVGRSVYMAILDCAVEDAEAPSPLCIYLERDHSGRYVRVLPNIVRTAYDVADTRPESVELYVKAVYLRRVTTPIHSKPRHIMHLSLNLPPEPGCTIQEAYFSNRCQLESLDPPMDHMPFRKREEREERLPWSHVICTMAVRLHLKILNQECQAVVIFGENQNDPGFWCAILDTPLSENLDGLFGNRHHTKLQHLLLDFRNVDRLTKEFRTGHVISVVARRGPRTIIDFQNSIEHHIIITAAQPPTSLVPEG